MFRLVAVMLAAAAAGASLVDRAGARHPRAAKVERLQLLRAEN